MTASAKKFEYKLAGVHIESVDSFDPASLCVEKCM